MRNLLCSWRGWSWLLAVLSLLPILAATLFYWQTYHSMQVRIQAIHGYEGIGLLMIMLCSYGLAALFALMALICATIAYIRLPTPRGENRGWEFIAFFGLLLGIILHFFVIW